MTTEKTTVEQAFREFEEFKKAGFEPGQGVFYDGAMDPLKRMAELLQWLTPEAPAHQPLPLGQCVQNRSQLLPCGLLGGQGQLHRGIVVQGTGLAGTAHQIGGLLA